MKYYHGTSLAKGLSIQENGFNVNLSGSNAGTLLGNGVYYTRDLAKAMNYAKSNPAGGVVLELHVKTGAICNVTAVLTSKIRYSCSGTRECLSRLSKPAHTSSVAGLKWRIFFCCQCSSAMLMLVMLMVVVVLTNLTGQA
jgi:hypothetical protein